MPHRRHRALVWSLIVLASLLLVVSMTANWVQRTALDTNEVVDQTDQILADDDVQKALSIFLVDQLYSTVDVEGQLKEELPSNVKALAAPVAAATKQLALPVAERTLASPTFQKLVSNAIRVAHERFVKLIRNENQYLLTEGKDVQLDYGALVADLAARVGVDPDTISKVQNFIQELATNLKQGLTKVQNEINSLRSGLSKVQGGTLSPALQKDLETIESDAAALQTKITKAEKAITDAQDKVPSKLQGRVKDLESRLNDLDGRLAELETRAAAVLEDPSQANVDQLDSALAAVDTRITAVLARPVMQSPGQLVLIKDSQLGGVQDIVRALRSVGIVLPILVFVLYAGALFLAGGWRREALIAAGGGILTAMLLVLLIRRLAGHAVVDSLAGSETVKPAVQSVWDIVSAGLRERALFLIVIGLAWVGGGILAGPGRHAVAARRYLAPYLQDKPALVYGVVAVVFLLWLTFIPGIENFGQILVILALAALAVFGIEVLRRQTAQEFPPGPSGS